MGCQHLDDFYELYLLGTAAGDAVEEINLHLERSCPYCLERLREAALTTYLLSRMTRSARPNRKLKSRLLSRLRKK